MNPGDALGSVWAVGKSAQGFRAWVLSRYVCYTFPFLYQQ